MEGNDDTGKQRPLGASADHRSNEGIGVSEAYLSAEMSELRQEVRFLIDLVVKTENIALIVIGACISFQFTVSGNEALRAFTSVFPIVVTLMGLWRFISLRKSIGRIDSYLKLVENQVLGAEFGWVRFHHSQAKSAELRSGFLPWIVMGFVATAFFVQTSPWLSERDQAVNAEPVVQGDAQPSVAEQN